MAKSIISIGLLLKEGGKLTGDHDNLIVFIGNAKLVFTKSKVDGLYYTDHSHDLNTGMTIANNTNVTHFRSPNTVHPHLHRKWLIDESNSTNNGPIFRKHVGSSLFINSTTSNQPYTRTFDYVPTISDIEEVGGSAQTNS